MTPSLPLEAMFKYKAWANEEMLGAIHQFNEETNAAERHRGMLILDHTWVVDRIFAAHLQGQSHDYTGLVSKELPSLPQLTANVRTSDAWYMAYVGSLAGDQLSELVDFTFTDGATGRMSRAEILMHLSLHGAYHRGAIGRILQQLSLAPPKDVFTRYLHEAEPARRRR